MSLPRGIHASDRWLPAEPLVAIAPKWDRYSLSDYGSMGGLKFVLEPRLQRAYYRAKRDGRVTVVMADELAVALGYHPAEIWGGLWWSDEETG